MVIKKGDFVIRKNTHSGSIGRVDNVPSDGEVADVTWNSGKGGSTIATEELKVVNSSPLIDNLKDSFSNGAARAQQEIANKMSAAGVRVEVENATRSMSKTEILKRAREGRWELQTDIDRKRNGDHVEVRMPSGATQHIRIEGE